MSDAGAITFLGDFSKKLVTNTFFNILGRFWNFLLTLLLTPFILSHLGVDHFGVWAILSTVLAGSVGLLDFGLGQSFVKFISAYYAHKDYDLIGKALSLGLLFYLIFGVGILAAGLALERPILEFFNLHGASSAFELALLACAISNIAAMFLSVFRGVQRMDKANAIEMRMALINAAGTVLVLQLGMGLFGLALNAVATSALSTLVSWRAVRRLLPAVSIGLRFDRGLLGEMFSYASKIQVSRVGTLISFQLDKLIISRYLGIGAVSFYEVGSRLAFAMRAIPLVLISALIPATSELAARNEKDKVLRAYLTASRYVAIMTIAMVTFLVIEASSLLNLWLGEGFESAVILVQILAIGYGANILGGAASQTGAGIGRPEFDMRGTALLVVLNPVLSLILTKHFNAAGAAAGSSLSLIAAAAYLVYTFHRNYAGTSVWETFRGIYARPAIAAVVAGMAVLGFHSLTPGLTALGANRVLIPVKMAVDLVAFGAVYVGLLIGLRQVTAIDKENFLGLLSFGVEFLRHPQRERVKIYR
jgi:O-antigen/teichoic acid export membrane protein